MQRKHHQCYWLLLPSYDLRHSMRCFIRRVSETMAVWFVSSVGRASPSTFCGGQRLPSCCCNTTNTKMQKRVRLQCSILTFYLTLFTLWSLKSFYLCLCLVCTIVSTITQLVANQIEQNLVGNGSEKNPLMVSTQTFFSSPLWIDHCLCSCIPSHCSMTRDVTAGLLTSRRSGLNTWELHAVLRADALSEQREYGRL